MGWKKSFVNLLHNSAGKGSPLLEMTQITAAVLFPPSVFLKLPLCRKEGGGEARLLGISSKMVQK